jgi:nucleoside phosphorylase
MAAAKVMLDEVHEDLPVSATDHNTYILGRIKEHNVVIACLPSGDYGLVSANTVAMQLLSSFHSIRFGLMVGIGGGVPSSVADIRLGDIVVSKPTGIHGGVVQYDYGKALSGAFQQTGMLNRPPQILLTALSKLQTYHLTEGSRIADFLAEVEHKIPRQALKFARPTRGDHLYSYEYEHVDPHAMTCNACDSNHIVSRPRRGHNEPQIHYGLIGSANQLVRDSKFRDRLGRELGVYCVEMEAAGLLNNFPCLVVRGICDYADSHKNKEWQGYASAVAAAYAKELILCTSVRQMDQAQTVRESLSNGMFLKLLFSAHLFGKFLINIRALGSEFHVPFDLTGVPAVENFLGRHEELEQLWHHLQPENKESRKVAVLHGLGGIGKTQLAIRFAREHKEHFTAIFWLAGKSRETLLQSMSSVLSQLPGQSSNPAATNEGEVEQNAKQVLRWLASPGNTRWLLIFDNIDQYSPGTDDGYDIGKLFPTADHGSILITSRLRSLTELGRSFPVQGFNVEDAISLLWQSRHLPVPDTATRQNQGIVQFYRSLH